ncbi:hypothetical protein D3C73_650920 [compost metagenome]
MLYSLEDCKLMDKAICTKSFTYSFSDEHYDHKVQLNMGEAIDIESISEELIKIKYTEAYSFILDRAEWECMLLFGLFDIVEKVRSK